MTNAMVLLPAARGYLTPAYREGVAEVDLIDFLDSAVFDRDLPLEDLRTLIDHAMVTFGSDDRVASDAWLAPRVHAVLRLRRVEAADRGLWGWLGAVEFPGYARWRFPGKTADSEEDPTKRGTPLKRFVGTGRDHAIARLWWGGELFRNGADYGPVVRAFAKQDVPNTWMSLDAVHHRAAAQAALRMLPDLSSDDINRLSTALDHVLTTIQLDMVAPIDAPDTFAADDWVNERADIDEVLGDALPKGPDEAPVPDDAIDAVEELIRHVASEIGVGLGGI